MKKDKYARKGFTLVELLIVIVVIGILSAMMMLSSTEAMSSAKASNIASNLRNLKTAALAWYTDHSDYVQADGKIKIAGTEYQDIGSALLNSTETDNNTRANILKYFNSEGAINFNRELSNKYDTYTVWTPKTNRNEWWVGYKFPQKNSTSIIEKLIGRAKTLGLSFGDSPSTLSATTPTSASGVTAVWMKVLGSTTD